MLWWLVATLVSAATVVPFELSDAKRAFYNSGAVELSAQNHSKCIESYHKDCDSNPVLFIEYFNGSDPEYFKEIASSFDQFAKDMLENSDVLVTFFDCAESPKACAKVEIKRLPSRRLHHWRRTTDYYGALDRKVVDSWLRGSLVPVPEIKTHKSFDRFWNDQSKHKVLLINPAKADPKDLSEFYSFGRSYNSRFSCARIESFWIREELSDKVPQISVGDESMWLYISANGKEVRVYPSVKFHSFDFLDFLSDHPVAIFHPEDLYNPRARGRDPSIPAAVMVVDREFDAENWGAELAGLAREYTGQLQFGTWRTKSNSLPEIFPKTTLFAIYDYQSGQVHAIDSQNHPNGIQFENIEAMVVDFLAGNMKYRSEPIPIAKGPMTTLVGETVLEAIGNVSQTVFVNYCEDGQCRANESIWQSLAAHYADNDTVLIAQYDYIKNERVPGKRVYAPTLAMYPANGVIDEITGFRNPVDYNEVVNMSSMIDFVDYGDPYGSVIELSMDTFEGFEADHEDVMVWFYAPSRIDKDKNSFKASKLTFDLEHNFNPNGKFARVNCDQERYFCFRNLTQVPTVKTFGSYFFGVPIVTKLEELERLFDKKPTWMFLHLNPTKDSLLSLNMYAKLPQPESFIMAQVAKAITESVEELFPGIEFGDRPTWLAIYNTSYVGVFSENQIGYYDVFDLMYQLMTYKMQDILEERFEGFMVSRNTSSENDSGSSKPSVVTGASNDDSGERSGMPPTKIEQKTEDEYGNVFNLYVSARLENPKIAEDFELFCKVIHGKRLIRQIHIARWEHHEVTNTPRGV
ncbi:hypothetical protein DICA4_E01024 [Diutina catenulata]